MSSNAKSSTLSPRPPLSTKPVLLPLLAPPVSARSALAPPLHDLPGGELYPSRIVHRQCIEGTGLVNWVATNHTFPAAYPRSHPESTSPPCQVYPFIEPAPLPLGSGEVIKNEERRRRTIDLSEFRRRKHVHANVSEFYPASDEHEALEVATELAAKAFPQLWATAQRIVPIKEGEAQFGLSAATSLKDSQTSYTLVLSHANGFHKETWHTMLQKLLDELVGRLLINEVWSLDTMGSGESGALNRTSLGETISWFDGARDLRQFLEHYVPSPPKKRYLPTSIGPGWPPAVLPRRSQEGMPQRKFIGVGHSYSASCFSMLAGTQPDLLDVVVLIDPPMQHPDNFLTFAGQPYRGQDHPIASKAVMRRDVWPNRDAARTYFLTRPYFQAWDHGPLESYVRHGLRPLSSGSEWVTLSYSKWVEFALFAAHMGAFGVSALRYGDYKGKIHHFHVEHTVQEPRDTEAINSAIARFGGTAKKLPGGHLIVQERPQLIGHEIAEVLIQMLGQTPGGSDLRLSLPRPRL